MDWCRGLMVPVQGLAGLGRGKHAELEKGLHGEWETGGGLVEKENVFYNGLK